MNNTDKTLFSACGYDMDGHCPTDLSVYVTSEENYTINWGCSGSGMYPGYGGIERIPSSYFIDRDIDDFRRDFKVLSGFLEGESSPCSVSSVWNAMIADYNNRKYGIAAKSKQTGRGDVYL